MAPGSTLDGGVAELRAADVVARSVELAFVPVAPIVQCDESNDVAVWREACP
jgi:hypothetical protein